MHAGISAARDHRWGSARAPVFIRVTDDLRFYQRRLFGSRRCVVPAAVAGSQAQNSGEKRDEVASPRLFIVRARVNGHESRGPISERA